MSDRALNPILCDEWVYSKSYRDMVGHQCPNKRGDDQEYPTKCNIHIRAIKLREEKAAKEDVVAIASELTAKQLRNATGVAFRYSSREQEWMTMSVEPLITVLDNQDAIWEQANEEAGEDLSAAKRDIITRALIQLRAEGYTLIPPRS
jgi:hypothetical protein